MTSIYLIGSLRNEGVPVVANELRRFGFDVFDDWYAAGPEADDYWKAYEVGRGRALPEALKGYAARHVFEFDKHHLERCDIAILLMPAGKSGHLELGYAAGLGKTCYVCLDGDPERYDVMYGFCTDVFENQAEMFKALAADMAVLQL